MPAGKMKVLEKPTLAHAVGHKVYLARPEVADDAEDYRKLLRAVYGSLRGVKVYRLDAGTQLYPPYGAADYYMMDHAQPTVCAVS